MKSIEAAHGLHLVMGSIAEYYFWIFFETRPPFRKLILMLFLEKKSSLHAFLLMGLIEYGGNTPWAPSHHQ
jgi:hypothetical protein